MSKAYLVPTFHHDIAYLRSESEYTAGCMKILDEALYILDNNPEYRFSLEQAWLLEEYWDARPEKREDMRRYAREGRLTIEPGLYAVPDMNLLDGESLYMQATIGRMIAEETLGAQPRVCMIADCWGHHGQIPQILKQCGYDYYAFSRCMRKDADRQNFIWRGADGSAIRAHWLSTHYDGVGFPIEGQLENKEELEWADAGAEGILALMELNREKCGDDPQYLPAGGDMRFPSRLAPKLVRALNARGDLPTLTFSSPAEALDAVDWSRAPEFGGEFESSMQGSFTTNIGIKLDDRRYAGELYALEALSAARKRQCDFTPAWKLHLKNQFHDIACGTLCNRALKDAEADSRALGHMLTNIRRSLTGGAGEKAYFNALPFPRAIRAKEGLLELPALGCAPASSARAPKPAQAPALPLTFENDWYSASIDANGYIERLIEKRSGAALTGGGAPFGAITMQLDYGDNWWSLSSPTLTRATQGYTMNRPDPLIRDDSRTFMPDITDARVISADEDCVVIKQTGAVRFWVTRAAFETTITLSKSQPEIAYHTEFANEAKNIRLRAAFPVNGLNCARRQIPYAIMGMETGEQAAQMFMDASGDAAGLAVINRGTPAGNIEDGVMLITLFRSAAMEYKCESDLSYSLGRSYAFDYAVLPHKANDDALIWRRALAFNTPVIACPLPESICAPRVEGAFVSCLRLVDEGMFMRLYNPFECEAYARVSLPDSARGAWLTDGLAAPEAETYMEGREIALTLGARKVQGVLIVFESEKESR